MPKRAIALLDRIRTHLRVRASARVWHGGRAMRAKGGGDPDRFKVRRGVAGSWRDYFSDAEAAEIERYIEHNLRPGFGYLASEAPGVTSLGTPAPARRVAAG